MVGQYLLIQAMSGDNQVMKWLGFALLLLEVAGKWKVLSKANEVGWSQFIPIWGDLVLLNVAELPWWWFIGLCIPGLDYVVAVIIGLCIARNFEKGVLFGLGLAFFPFIFYPILGFGSDEWGGPGGYHSIGV